MSTSPGTVQAIQITNKFEPKDRSQQKYHLQHVMQNHVRFTTILKVRTFKAYVLEISHKSMTEHTRELCIVGVWVGRCSFAAQVTRRNKLNHVDRHKGEPRCKELSTKCSTRPTCNNHHDRTTILITLMPNTDQESLVRCLAGLQKEGNKTAHH
jgi:hypothetical protein